MEACRNSIQSLGLTEGSHPGLMLSRYLHVPVNQGEEHVKARLKLLEAVINALNKIKPFYEKTYERWYKFVNTNGVCKILAVQGRLIVGLGSESPLETGLCLHHTYGVPIIPGSALKGLAAHYCNQIWRWGGESEYFKTLFGTQDENGIVTFYDAMITPDTLANSLVRDVMTVHHENYYNQGSGAPSDMDDPNPIQFLSVKGHFTFAVKCTVETEEGKKWQKMAMDLLMEALASWGIGGKTNAGYGRVVEIKETTPSNTFQSQGPRYKNGDKVTVTRVNDPKPKKGKERIWLQADDGIGGVVTAREDQPKIEIGEKCECWILSINQNNTYNFSSKSPKR